MLTPVQTTMKKRRKCSFNPAWEHQYAFVKRSRKGNGYFYCAYCAKDINVQTMGISAVKSHIDNNKHKQMEKSCCHLDYHQKMVMNELTDDGAEGGEAVQQQQYQEQQRQRHQQWFNLDEAAEKVHDLQRHHFYATTSNAHDMQMKAETMTRTAQNVLFQPKSSAKAEGNGLIMSDFEDESANEMSLANNDEEEEDEEGQETAPWQGGKFAKYFEQIVNDDGIFMAKVRCLICGKELSTKSRTSIREHNKLHQLAALSDGSISLGLSVFDERKNFSAAATDATTSAEAIATAFVEERKPIVMMPMPPTMAAHRRRRGRVPAEMIASEAAATFAKERRCESVENDDDTAVVAANAADDVEHRQQPNNLTQFGWDKRRLELQILEAELIQKQLSNYQRCTELGIRARIHLPSNTVLTTATTLGSSTGRSSFVTFSNEHMLQQKQQCVPGMERQRRHVEPTNLDNSTRENGDICAGGDDDGLHFDSIDNHGTTPCDFVAFADI